MSLRGATLRYSAPAPPALSARGPLPASPPAPEAAAADSHAPFALQDLSLDIAAGQLTTVVGSVGSGARVSGLRAHSPFSAYLLLLLLRFAAAPLQARRPCWRRYSGSCRWTRAEA